MQSSYKESEEKARERKGILKIQGSPMYKRSSITPYDFRTDAKPKEKPVKYLTFNDKIEIFTETEINGYTIPIIIVSDK